KAIGNYVFYECGSLTSIDIPDSVEYIGDSAFMDCGDLEECELPASLKEVGSNAFSNCDNIKGFTFPKGFRKLGMCALDYTDPDFVMFPASLETVEGESFVLSEGGTIYFGGSEAQFKSLFKTVIEAHDREWSQEGENYLFFDRHRVYYDLPDGPVLAQSLEVDAPDTFNVGEKVDVNVRILPENATCDYVRIYFDSYYINAKQDGDLHATLSAWAPDSGDLRVEIRDGSGLTYTKTITAIDNKQYDSYKYNIAFNGNGATSGKMSQLSKVAYTKNQTLTANAFKRTGYTFTGWNTAKDGSGTSYSNKEVVRGLTETNGGTVTLYAQWEIIPYTITYNLGSDDAVNAETNPSSYDVATAFTLAAPTRPFSTFQGWYSDAKLKNKVTNIKKGSTGNKTFYAKWTTNKYSISFKGNGATSGKMNDLTGIVYNADKTLTTNAFKRTGYHFVEWNTAADGSGDSYANKQVVNGLTTENGVKIALYAIWEKDIYTISYVLNGADAVNASENPVTYDVETAVTLTAPTREHYTFGGWYSDKKLKKKASTIKKGSTGNKTFYAKWTPNKYNIAYNGNGSTSGKMKNTTGVAYGSSKKLTGNAYSRKGYKFIGWNTAADGSGTSYANKASVLNLAEDNGVTVTLYAQWEIENYKITYNLNGGTAPEGNPATYTVADETITLAAPTKTGYTFSGWYSDKKLKKKAPTIKAGSTGSKTFYAKWTANKYTIVFDGNGATGGSTKKISGVSYGSSKKLTANGFKKTGATFQGWNTEPDGSGTTYKNKASVKNLTAENGATVTLYAIWSN
ncbi:MAG: InlB B-repeat-containing protein, partial [Oscillospiraceae bacterium]|nr:InlB B-repeat-containing protein [Oscillospiraceae bacterium]